MVTPDISVIVPTHDVGTWIDECLTSLLDDQDVDLEVVVVDDDSSDDTWDRVLAHAARDPRVRPFRAPGVGGGQARNFGVEQARGEYLAFVDGDDLVPRGAYAAMLASLRESGSDMVVGDFLKFSALTTWSPTAAWTGFHEPVRGTTLAERPQLVRNRACWNRLFRASFWRGAGLAFPSVPRSNDIVPMVAALTAARTIDVVPDVVYLYRERPGASSMTAQASAEVGVSSYLSQELLCARLLGAVDGEQLEATYWQMVLDSDGWVHLRRYARDAGQPADGATSVIPGQVRELLGLRRRRSWARLRPERQMVYALCTLGDTAAARAVLDASGDGGVEVVPMEPVAALTAVRAAEGTGLVTTEVLAQFVRTFVVSALAARTEPLEEPVADQVLALAAQHPAWFDAAPGLVERPQDTRMRVALRTGDREALLRVVDIPDSYEVTSLEVGRTAASLVLALPAEMHAMPEVTLRAYKEGRPETLRGIARVRFTSGAWRAVVLATALPSEGTWVVELLAVAPGEPLQVPLRIERSHVVLKHGRVGLLTVRGKARGEVPVTLFRRASVVRRAVRAVRRRRAA